MYVVKISLVILVICSLIELYHCGKFSGAPTTTPRPKSTSARKYITTSAYSHGKTVWTTTSRHKYPITTTFRPKTTSKVSYFTSRPKPKPSPKPKPTTTPTRKTTAPTTTSRPKSTSARSYKTTATYTLGKTVWTPTTTTFKPKTTSRRIYPTTPPLIIYPKPSQNWRNVTSKPKPSPKPKPTTTPTRKTTAPTTTLRRTVWTKTTTFKPKTTSRHIYPTTPPLIIYPKPSENWRNVTSKPNLSAIPPKTKYPKPTTKPTRTTTYKTTPTTTHYRDRVEKLSWNDLPPAPGSDYKSKSKVVVESRYHYYHPGYFAIPVPNKNHPQYYSSVPSYHYTASDTGSGVLGFYLGHKLTRLTTPTFSHRSFYDGYRPRYDHYTVHHYYHNKQNAPKTQTIQSNDIITCVGDSANICPTNVTSLCTMDGRLMCVVPVTITSNCVNVPNATCAKTLVSCVNNPAAECVGARKNSTLIDIPCLATTQIYGNLKIVDSTIRRASPESSHIHYQSNRDPTPTAVVPHIWKRFVTPSQKYCVVIVASPAPRKETKGETAFNDASDFFNSFIERVLDL